MSTVETADPVLVEIVAGTLAAIEREVETSIGRTSRSPMIRDAHDFRAGIHDRKLRKLTGRSYSALVHPVVRDHPIETPVRKPTVAPMTYPPSWSFTEANMLSSNFGRSSV